MDAAYWNAEAGRAWAEGAPAMDRILAPFAEALLEAAAVSDASAVIDVGCGCGATTLMVAERVRDATVVGVDVSRPMLDVARSRAPQNSRVRFMEADAATARPVNAPVDRVISRFGVMFFASPLRAFANIRGWLRPGGTLCALVWNPLDRNPWLSDLVEIVGRYTHHAWRPGEGPGPFSLADAEATAALLDAAGWGATEQRNLQIPMRVEGSRDDVLSFCLHRGPVASALAEASEPARAAITDALGAWVEARYDSTGATLAASARCIHAVAP